MIGDGGGGIGDQIIDVDPDMVVIDIIKLKILDDVKLHGEDLVREVVHKADVLARQSFLKPLEGVRARPWPSGMST